MAVSPGLFRQVTGLMAGHVMDFKFETDCHVTNKRFTVPFGFLPPYNPHVKSVLVLPERSAVFLPVLSSCLNKQFAVTTNLEACPRMKK